MWFCGLIRWSDFHGADRAGDGRPPTPHPHPLYRSSSVFTIRSRGFEISCMIAVVIVITEKPNHRPPRPPKSHINCIRVTGGRVPVHGVQHGLRDTCSPWGSRASRTGCPRTCQTCTALRGSRVDRRSRSRAGSSWTGICWPFGKTGRPAPRVTPAVGDHSGADTGTPGGTSGAHIAWNSRRMIASSRWDLMVGQRVSERDLLNKL